MIFVTVGTHEQPFNRLIKAIDKLKEKEMIKEDVIIQTGFSTYEPKFCIWEKFFSYQNMLDNVKKARIMITHGGPSSFFMALQIGKVPIVVPRQKRFHEHINDHQIEFSKAVAEKTGNILVVEEIEQISEVILHYDSIVKAMSIHMKSNNIKFNESLENIVKELLKKGK